MAEASDLDSRNVQSAVTCDTCEATAEHLCNTCHDKLCTRCKDIHRKSRASFDHEVTHLTFESLTRLTGTSIICRSHPRFRADVCCGKCDIPVCEICLIGEHSDHKTISTEELLHEKKRKLAEKYSFVQSELPKYLAQMEKLEQNEKKIIKSEETIENEIVSHFKEVRQKIKIEENRLLNTAKSHHHLEHSRLKTQKAFTSEHTSKLESFLRMYEKEITRDRYEFILYADISRESTTPENFSRFPSPFTLQFTKRILYANLFDQLSGKICVRLMRELLEVEIIRIGTGSVETLSYQLDDDSFWVFLTGDSCFKKCSRSGEVLFQAKTQANDTLNKPICILHDSRIIYRKTKTGLVQVNKNKEETAFLDFSDDSPISIYLSGANPDIAVGTVNLEATKGKILKYNTRGQWLGEVKHELLFRNIISKNGRPTKMAENINGDIYISNTEVDVFDKKGNFRFSYTGWKNAKFSFHPSGICADIMGNILIADEENCCIHVLDIDGQRQKMYDVSSGQDEFRPITLAIDANHCLCVGCSDGKIRVFKYIE